MNLKTVIGFAIGPIGAAAAGLASTPLIAWIFTQEDVGRFSIFQTVLSLILVFSVLGLDQAFVREYHATSDKNRLFKACFFPGLLVLLLFSALAYPFAPWLSKYIFGVESQLLVVLTLIAACLNYFSRFLSLILRMAERGFAFSMSQVLPKIVLLVVVIVYAAIPFEKTLIHLLFATLLSMMVVLLIYGWNTRRELIGSFNSRIDKEQLRNLFGFGFPLIFAGLAFLAISAVSIFSLRMFSTLSELAIYSVATKFAGAAVIIQAIFSIIWTPLVFKWEANNVDMRRVDSVARSVLALICIFAGACGSLAWVTDFILPQNYHDVKFLLVCAMAQPLLYTLSVVTSVGIGLSRRNGFSLATSVVALLANCLLCWLLVPGYGANGAVTANALSFFLLFILNTEASSYVWQGFPRTKIYLSIFVLVTFSIATVFLGPSLGAVIWLVWMVLLPLTLITFRLEIFELFKMIGKRSC